MSRAVSLAAFYLSAAFASWFVVIPMGIALIAFFRMRIPVILGGALMDALFGVPLPALGGFAYVYTALFALLAAIDLSLRSRMLD